MKHTPGPWEYEHELQSDGKWEFEFHSVKTNKKRMLRMNHSNAEADAYLIAAAPEMYKTLNWLVHLCHDTGKKGGRPEPDKWEEAIKQAEEALKKARGE